MATSSRLVVSPPFASISRDESSSVPSVRTSSFHGVRLRIFNRSTDLQKRFPRSFAVADMVIDGATSPQLPPEDKEKVVKEVPAPAVTSASLSDAAKFISDVSNLAKLVDSKDIVELELKHKDYEIVIRKAEALAPPPAPVPVLAPPVLGPSYKPYPEPAPSPAIPPPQEEIVNKESEPEAAYPTMVSPMAGTFYRASGPGEPPFVKEGDRVKKGQVICIIEAMKLMNEIECDQDGTIVKIIADDAKPVSADTPLFMIQP